MILKLNKSLQLKQYIIVEYWIVIALLINAKRNKKISTVKQTGNCRSEIPGNPLDNLSNVSLLSAWRSNVNDGAQYYLLCAHSI